ncbi:MULTISPECIES: protein kinase domain-containing protein [Enterobacter]|uniref:protein kinase domain-containing protein n=1 Tax=Enterobacter TaxID=547 RepID=UPI002DBCFE8F|nr:protein kinase [Enterobacter mori]MEB7566762.1 protein kinase [Enterobacter mori]HDC4575215.1 protein kinase [Enterobacter cloacae]
MVGSVWNDKIDAKNAGWIADGDKKSGGQGEAWPAVRSDIRAFLKVLKSQKDSERRARMYREAVALYTYEHEGIPSLIESNCHLYKQMEYKLYLVTELVQGPTLREYIEKNGTMPFQQAVDMTDRLLDIVEYYHSRDGIHRDIKPDNIILRNSNPADAVLVDFGLAWQPQDEDAHATSDSQELGNRFLRLNELAPDSPNKRDPRSDITFVVGILFYVLTGKNPNVLEESETGRRPHQREGVSESIHAATNSWALSMLALFDRGFSPLLNSRFQTAQELRQELKRMSGDKPPLEDDEILLEIKKRLEAQGAEINKTYFSKIKEAVREIIIVRNKIVEEIGDHLSGVETGYYKYEPRHSWLNIGFDTPGTSYPRFRPTFDFQIIADELSISVFSEDREGVAQVIWRTPVTNSDFGDVFRNKIKEIFVAGLRAIFSQ